MTFLTRLGLAIVRPRAAFALAADREHAGRSGSDLLGLILIVLLATQLLGFGLSGLVYNLLVRPSKMVWPSTLVPISLFNTLHGTEKNKQALTSLRLRFFKIAFLGIFAWQFLPSGK